jgi:hypothetical protein
VLHAVPDYFELNQRFTAVISLEAAPLMCYDTCRSSLQ